MSRTPIGPIPPPVVFPFEAEQASEHQQKWAKHLGVPVELTHSLGLRLRFVPPGEFDMGSNDGGDNEKPIHTVKLTRGYYLGVLEVTQDQYQRVMQGVPRSYSGRKADPSEDKRYPIDNVSWGSAVEFCRRLSTWPEEVQNKRVYRLPTEAEWEYATRAGTNSKWWCGDDVQELPKYEWYNVHGRSRSVHFVGEKQANPWGFHDMAGNTWEFCHDIFGPYPESPVENPTGLKEGSHRVVRGGCWFLGAESCRSTARMSTGMAPHRRRIIGFRVALDLP